LGPEKFVAMLRATERVDVPLPRLKEIAAHDLERSLEAMRQACTVLTPGQPIEACLAKLQADKLVGTAVEAASKQLDKLHAFVEEKRLFTIPGSEQARVAESLPYERWNFAYIRIPGPFEKNLPATYYISPPDPKWSKEEQQAYVPGENPLLLSQLTRSGRATSCSSSTRIARRLQSDNYSPPRLFARAGRTTRRSWCGKQVSATVARPFTSRSSRPHSCAMCAFFPP